MALALYAPGLGYYMAGARKLGRDGDFITAPEISPLFGRTLARQLQQLTQAGLTDVLEIGAGSGALAADLLLETGTAGMRARALPDPRTLRRTCANAAAIRSPRGRPICSNALPG